MDTEAVERPSPPPGEKRLFHPRIGAKLRDTPSPFFLCRFKVTHTYAPSHSPQQIKLKRTLHFPKLGEGVSENGHAFKLKEINRSKTEIQKEAEPPSERSAPAAQSPQGSRAELTFHVAAGRAGCSCRSGYGVAPRAAAVGTRAAGGRFPARGGPGITGSRRRRCRAGAAGSGGAGLQRRWLAAALKHARGAAGSAPSTHF